MGTFLVSFDFKLEAAFFLGTRLIAQCDVKDGVGQLVNFNFDEDLLDY